MSEVSFDPYYKWFGIPRNEQPPHYYRLLGITPFEADHDVIETAADQRMSHVRTFQAGKHGELSQKLLNELAVAKLTLLQPPKKAEYDQALQAKMSRQQPAAAKASQLVARLLPKAQPLEERPLTAPANFAAQPKPTAISSRQTLKIHPVAIAGVGAAALVVLLIGGVLVARALQGGDAPEVATNQPIENDGPPVPPPDPPATTPAPLPVRPVDPTTVRPEPTVDPPTTPPTPEPEDPPTPEPTEPPPETPPPEPEPEPIAPSPQPTLPVQPIDDAADGLPKLPNDADVAAAIKEIKELFKQEYASTRSEDKQSLAKKLLEQAGETASDPVAQVALLNESQRLAVAVADYETASAAIDALSGSFSVEPFALKADALQAIAKLTRLPDYHQAIADAALVLLDPAADAQQFDAAKTLAVVASASARKARNLDLVKHIEQRSKAIETQRKAFAALQAARDALARNPDDPEANAALGKYLCLAQGEWTAGLAHLGRGNDEALRNVALDDFTLHQATAPSTPEAQLRLGDAWWDYGAIEPAFRGRAAFWYDMALPSLTGLAKVKIERRLDEVAEAGFDGGMGLGSLAASAVVLLTFEETSLVADGGFAVQDLSSKQSVFKGKAKLVPGVAGKGAYFSGQNDSIGGGKDIPAANAPRTYSLWIKSESAGDVRYNFNGGTADGGKFLMFVFCTSGGHYFIDLYNYSVATKVPVDARWHHHCAAYNGKELIYLIDGVVVGAQTYDLATSPSGLSLGGSPCAIDEVAVFDRALTDKEVARLYQMGKNRRVLKVVEEAGRMNFTAALAATDPAERDRLIAAEFASHDWLDVAAKWLSHGGWPEFAAARVLEVTPDTDALRAAIILDYVELCPQGCNAYPRRFNGTATGELVIDRCSGQHAFDLYI